jgi:hypothetical protein
VETLLRELEAQLRKMTAADRAEVARGFQALFSCGRSLGDRIAFSGRTAMAFAQLLMLGMAQNRTLASYLKEAQAVAPKVGPYASALVSAIS